MNYNDSQNSCYFFDVPDCSALTVRTVSSVLVLTRLSVPVSLASMGDTIDITQLQYYNTVASPLFYDIDHCNINIIAID